MADLDVRNINLAPTDPTWAAAYGVARALIASAGVIGTLWSFARTDDLVGLYNFFHTSQFAGFVSAVVAAGCLAWGFWKKRKDKTELNATKAALDPNHAAAAVVDPTAATVTIAEPSK